MKKLKLLGLGNDEGRQYFVFEKSIDFLRLFPSFLESLGLQKTGHIMNFESEEPNMKMKEDRDESMPDVVDVYEHVENSDYDMDIFYGDKKITVVVRTQMRQMLMTNIKEVADFEGF